MTTSRTTTPPAPKPQLTEKQAKRAGQSALAMVLSVLATLAVALMAIATYVTVSIALRSVAALRHGAADITAAGLAEQRLPVPPTRDEIHNLAETLNAMLDRIDSTLFTAVVGYLFIVWVVY